MGGRPRIRENHVHPLVVQLRNLRKAKRLTLEGLSVALGYNAYTIGRWERGDMPPTLFALDAWAQALGVKLSFDLGPKLSLPTRHQLMAGK